MHTSDTRNTVVVATLITAMTFGAALLSWLEPRALRASRDNVLMMAEGTESVDRVIVEFAASDAAIDTSGFDCVVHSDGSYDWQPQSARIRLLVLGGPQQDAFDAQKITLMTLFHDLSRHHGLNLARISLDPDSDARLRDDLPRPARDLAAWLERKGFVERASAER